jgi:hypothetical protein
LARGATKEQIDIGERINVYRGDVSEVRVIGEVLLVHCKSIPVDFAVPDALGFVTKHPVKPMFEPTDAREQTQISHVVLSFLYYKK